MNIVLFNTSLQINADLFGYLALSFFTFSFLMQSTRKTFLAQAPADACYGIHFLMLGSLTGCMVSLAAACRDLFAGLASERIMRIAIFIYLGLIWSVTFFTFNNYLHPPVVWQAVPCFLETIITIPDMSSLRFKASGYAFSHLSDLSLA